MKASRPWILLLSGAMALNGLAGVEPAGSYTLEGTVLDIDDRPVPDAVVERFRYGDGFPLATAAQFEPFDPAVDQITTDSEGRFHLHLPRRGAVVLVRKPGYATVWKQFHNFEADTEERFVLIPPSTLAGIVVDENDQPVPDAEVYVAGAFLILDLGGGRQSYSFLSRLPARHGFSTRTAADGRFRFDAFHTNAVADLAVRVPGKALFAPAPATRQPISPDSLPGRAGRQDIKLVVEPAGWIEGRVVTAESGSSLPSAWLWVEREHGPFYTQPDPVRSAADGSFLIPDLAAGDYALRTVFGTNPFADWVADRVGVSVDAGKPTTDVTVLATQGGVLHVVAHSPKDDQPVTDASIRVFGQTYQAAARSDAQGLAWLRLPPGDYQIAAWKDNTLAEEQYASVEFNRTNRIEIILHPPPTVTGLVLDPDNQPVVGVHVTLFVGYMGRDDAARATTDANGRYELTWEPRRYMGMGETVCLVVRDMDRNLAIAHDIDEETRLLDLRLE